MVLALWELLLFMIILRVMFFSQTRFCENNNISTYDCDYNGTNIKHLCMLVGYLIGKRLLFNY